ncbi:MAG: hypothetical protein R8K46_06030 [Mariprofundaceae bacterium]
MFWNCLVCLQVANALMKEDMTGMQLTCLINKQIRSILATYILMLSKVARFTIHAMHVDAVLADEH